MMTIKLMILIIRMIAIRPGPVQSSLAPKQTGYRGTRTQLHQTALSAKPHAGSGGHPPARTRSPPSARALVGTHIRTDELAHT